MIRKDMKLLSSMVYLWWGMWYQRNMLAFSKLGLDPIRLALMVDQMKLAFQSTLVPSPSKTSSQATVVR